MFDCVATSTRGAELSKDSVLPSLPLVSHAKPMRGAGLKRCPFKQPALEEAPMSTVGNPDVGARGKFPPFPPHWTTPFSGLPVGLPNPDGSLFGISAPALCVTEPSLSIAGASAAPHCVGSKLNACL